MTLITHRVNIYMIQSFKSKATEDIYHGIVSRDALKVPQVIWAAAWRKLDMLNSAVKLQDLRSPPANRLEALKGNLKGRFSIRINQQYRLVFRFYDGHAYDVEIADYH